VEHEVLVDEQLDEEKLKAVAGIASLFFLPGDGKMKIPLTAARKMVATAKRS
jgi:hypothetical protein